MFKRLFRYFFPLPSVTDEEIKFNYNTHIPGIATCSRCGCVFNDHYRRYYPCPTHPPV